MSKLFVIFDQKQKKVEVSIVTIFKHTLRYALCTSMFQKMSDGLSNFLQIFLRNFSLEIA